MKNKNLKRISMMFAAVMLAGVVTGCGAKKDDVKEETNVSVSTEADVSVSTEADEKIDESTVQDVYTGIDDVYVLKDAKDVNYLHGVLYDSSIVKDVTVDSSEVDLTKEGIYKIIYEITLDLKAFNKYKGSNIDELYNNKILITKETTVVNKDKAQELADENKEVLTGGDETAKKSDGTEVKNEQKAPASTAVTNGTVVNAATKEEVKPTVTAEPTEEPKAEETKKEESNPAASTENKEDTKTPTSGGSSNGSQTSTTKPSSGSNQPVHTCTWVDIIKEVNHPAVTHEEPVYEEREVLVSAAWDEEVEDGTTGECVQCGFQTKDVDEMGMHMIENGHSCHWITLYKTVHHDAVYKTERVQVGTKTVVDQAAWTETVVTGQKCSGCGRTK